MTLYDDLAWRGLVHQVTHPELVGVLAKDRVTLYAGIDPTADSLHIGHLMAILGMMRFQRAGHRPIAVIGGATAMIGDPSFKSEERKLLSTESIEQNVAGVRAQLGRFLDFSHAGGALLLNNADWLAPFPILDFLRDVGKHFSVNAMIARDSVKVRLESREQGISFTEFTYSLLQAYDFLHLTRAYDCRLQIGGSDQWGNIVAGIDLTRRLEQKDTFGLTWPLVTKADGAKFGKTESGTVWLDGNRTSPYRFYQFWINQSDADAQRWLRAFTFLDLEAILAIETQTAESPEKRAAQRALAEEVTRLVHSQSALDDAVRASEAMFGGSLAGLDASTLEDIFDEMPSTQLPRSVLSGDHLLADVLVECSVFKSKGEARRLIQSGGLYLNNERVTSGDLKLTEGSLCNGRIVVIRTGKKAYHLLKFTA